MITRTPPIPARMAIFVSLIAADTEAPPEGAGYVRAETAKKVVTLVGHPEVTVIHLPADAEWPGGPGEQIYRGP